MLWKAEPWDSDVLGVPVARVLQLHDPCTVIKECRARNIRYVFAKVPLHNVQALHDFQDRGFRTICGELTMELDDKVKLPPEDDTFRLAAPHDEDRLREIAACSFSHSRFHFDPTISDDVANHSRVVWVSNAVRNLLETPCAVVVNRELSGFVVCTADADGERGSIDLIAVHPRLRGDGRGRALCTQGIHWLKRRCARVEVVVQLANIPAVNMYLSEGFRPVAPRLVMRRWLEY